MTKILRISFKSFLFSLMEVLIKFVQFVFLINMTEEIIYFNKEVI